MAFPLIPTLKPIPMYVGSYCGGEGRFCTSTTHTPLSFSKIRFFLRLCSTYIFKKPLYKLTKLFWRRRREGESNLPKSIFLNTTNATLQTAYPYNYLPTNKPKYQSMPNLSYGVGMHYSTLYKLTHIWNTKNGWG